jgi:hypothetical protein
MKPENRRIDIKSLVLGVLVGASIMLSVAAATTAGNRTTWEYKVVQGTVFGKDAQLEDYINSHAAQGWDFVSASPSKDQYGFAVMRREKK